MYNILMYNNILIIIYKNILRYHRFFLFYLFLKFIFSNFQVKLFYNIYYHEVMLSKIKTLYIN